jgi:hypothetical protein
MKADKSLVFDVQFGASGDMLLAALLDLGLDLPALEQALGGLAVAGWRLTTDKITRNHFAGRRFTVECRDETHERNLACISAILNESRLPGKAASRAIQVFNVLAEAEASVHGVTPAEIHFHEVGALDSIIDIAGFCAALEILGVDTFYYGDIPLGRGSTPSRHGELPQPSPALSALVKGRSVTFTDRRGELVTPTAAAILTALGIQAPGPGISATVIAAGTGFGSREYPFPSFTRAFLIESQSRGGEHVIQLECNIDDMNPQIYPYLIERLLDEGALDAYCLPVVMKKGRPGTVVTVIADAGSVEALKALLYRETTTLGLRETVVVREKLERSFEEITLEGRTVRIKVARHNGKVVNIQPEFEDCKTVSAGTGIALKAVIERARDEYRRQSLSAGDKV